MQNDPANAETGPVKSYWHPYLVALFPAANIYVANWNSVELKDLILPVVAVLAFAYLVYALLKRICSDAEKAAILASWTIACSFSYAALHNILDFSYHRLLSGNSSVHTEYVLAVWTLLWLVGATWIVKSKRQLSSVNSFFTSIASILLVMCAVKLGWQWSGESQLHKQTSDGSWIQQPIALEKPSQPRDVYFLVFDRYGGEDTLRRSFQLDNTSFLEQLRTRGFQVSSACNANYPRTILSICSTLNLSYLPEESRSDRYYSQMIDNHLVGRCVKDLGYEYHHFGNWYQPLRTSKNATRSYSKSLFPSEYAESLYGVTPLSKVIRSRSKYDLVNDKFNQVAEIATNKSPTFVYAHFLVPHPPYVLDRDGSRLTWADARYGDAKENFVRQLEGTNKCILNTIDRILKDSDQTPIIILQADEGPYLSQETRALDRKMQILTRARILSAFLLPSSNGEIVLPQSLSPVNAFRFIFREYFGADIPLLPDRTFYWDQADQLGRPASDNKRYIDETSSVAK